MAEGDFTPVGYHAEAHVVEQWGFSTGETRPIAMPHTRAGISMRVLISMATCRPIEAGLC